MTGIDAHVVIRDVVSKAQGSVSMMYKVHTPNQTYHKSADFFLVTHRDPYDMVCPQAKMFAVIFFKDLNQALRSDHTMAQDEKRIFNLAEAAGPENALHMHSSALHSIEGMTEVVEAMARM